MRSADHSLRRHPQASALRASARLLLAMATASLGLVACADGGAPVTQAPERVDETAAEQDVAVRAHGRDVTVTVQVTPAMRALDGDADGLGLDASALDDLVGERIQDAIDDGTIELGTVDAVDPGVELVDTSNSDGLSLPEAGGPSYVGCVVYMGQVVYDYVECGCKYSEYYDKFYNNCNGQYSYVYVTDTVTCHSVNSSECP